ncbi:MAG TPA: phospho-N-acetylmuramoyl-pentapeptide-transferase, partial [Synergistaceae bacterium]|nr:phospho-N-acetylmuramoyl-pentapeptide-transferase [Synergistaceae bacterium]
MKFVVVIAVVMALEIWLQERWIGKLHQWRVTLIQKAYGPRNHIATKSSTPSMGGVVFIPVALVTIPLIGGLSLDVWSELGALWLLPLGAAAIGFADDWIKFRMKSSEGFASIYKLVAQIVLVIPWAYWTSVYHGISLWPGIELPVWLAVPVIMFLSIGVLNAVNVTDGLDGLAAGACILS